MTAAVYSKACTKCGCVKPFAEFYASNSKPSGHYSSCKRCVESARSAKRALIPKPEAPPPPATERLCTRCGVTKPLHDFSKDKYKKLGVKSWCKVCAGGHSKQYVQLNREKVAVRERAYYSKNSEKRCANARDWKLNNPDKYRSYLEADRENRAEYRRLNAEKARLRTRQWAAENKDRVKEYQEKNAELIAANARRYRELNGERMAAQSKGYREANRGLLKARGIRRMYNEKQATPSWADMRSINAVYIEAKRLEALDGIKRHVDHVIPLKNKLVCGLHVEHNLAIIPAEENLRKNNRFEIQ